MMVLGHGRNREVKTVFTEKEPALHRGSSNWLYSPRGIASWIVISVKLELLILVAIQNNLAALGSWTDPPQNLGTD